MTRLIAALIILCASAAAHAEEAPTGAAAGGGPVAVRTEVTVKDALVRLGDLFRNTGDKAHIAIAYAPSPGQSAVIDAAWLVETARRNGLDWRPTSQSLHVVVHRASAEVPAAAVIKVVESQLRAAGVQGKLKIELAEPLKSIHLPADSKGEFAIHNLRYNARSGHFEGVVAATAGSGTHTVPISGRVSELIELPVLARSIARGEIVRARDIEMRTFPRSAATTNDVITKRKAVIGQAARRAMRKDLPLRASSFEPPILVKRGSIATMEIETAYMRVTARGRALDTGAKGDTVRLRNVSSKKLVEGTVVGAGRVVVKIPSAVAGR
jgi:flagella basal body P-ring formation protein FlgA